jgi:hypothetical protein
MTSQAATDPSQVIPNLNWILQHRRVKARDHVANTTNSVMLLSPLLLLLLLFERLCQLSWLPLLLRCAAMCLHSSRERSSASHTAGAAQYSGSDWTPAPEHGHCRQPGQGPNPPHCLACSPCPHMARCSAANTLLTPYHTPVSRHPM